jgi:hypothetical protein
MGVSWGLGASAYPILIFLLLHWRKAKLRLRSDIVKFDFAFNITSTLTQAGDRWDQTDFHRSALRVRFP